MVPPEGTADSTRHARQLHLPLLRKKRYQFLRQDERQVRTRRLNNRGYLKPFSHLFAVGREHASKTVTVMGEGNEVTVLGRERFATAGRRG
jgi:hypothetical protein